METIIGSFAALFTTIAFIPQVIKVHKTKHTKDISIGMFLLMNAGLVLWLIYGIIIYSHPVIIANAVTLVFAIYILFMKIKVDVLPSQNRTKRR